MTVDSMLHETEAENGHTELREALPVPLPRRLPIQLYASGLYQNSIVIGPPLPQPIQPRPIIPPIPERLPVQPRLPARRATDFDGEIEEQVIEAAALPLAILREELRLDVDGRFPLMMASGTIQQRLRTRVHWLARLTNVGRNQYAGPIWYKDGSTAALPHTNVAIHVVRSVFPNQRIATVTFIGGGAPNRVVRFTFASQYFRPCEFEYDRVQGTNAVTTFDTATHPNKPASLPNEVISIERVYQRAGIHATMSPNGGVIPLATAGPNVRWSDAEMHDAMTSYWSRFGNRAQWAAWVLFASLSDSGSSLGGIMFDSIGPNHRQGTAIFEDSFIANPPAGDPNAAAAVQRIKFWTAVHEIGHTFNLAHAWQKSLGTPWIPLADEPLARSFMNYPYRVPGGATSFFSDFEYRFSDSELLFMRHAPARFVEQGFADWFDHHGFTQSLQEAKNAFKLEIRVNRDPNEFQFMEPVVIELKLKNTSGEPQIIDSSVLKTLDHMTIVVKRQGTRPRVFQPFARYCYKTERRVLNPGESVYESLFVASGLNEWVVAEPGRYVIQMALHDEEGDIVSNALNIRVTPPDGYEEEYLAQDLFTEDVGRVLAFDGSRELTGAVGVLREVTERLKARSVATHARVALAVADMREYKSLSFQSDGVPKAFVVSQPDAKAAFNQLNAVLRANGDATAETLGHVDTNYYAQLFSDWLASTGRAADAAAVLEDITQTFENRKVSPAVLAQLREKRASVLATTGVKGPASRSADVKSGARRR